MTNVFVPKFEECGECIFAHHNRRSPACRRCEAGENFEPRIAELHPERLELKPREEADDE